MKSGMLTAMLCFLFACNGQRNHKTTSEIPNSALQLIEVITADSNAIHGKMQLFERADSISAWKLINSFAVVIGKNGLAADRIQNPIAQKIKHEGDGCSPAGIFSLSKIFSYNNLTDLQFPFKQVDENDLCVDDVTSLYYNLLIDDDTIALKDYTSFESMQRNDLQYEYGVWVNYNTSPQIAGAGSCIFLHIWKDENHGTSGCTAMEKENMLTLIHWMDEKKCPLLYQHVKQN